MRNLVLAILTTAACATSPSADPCDAYAIELGSGATPTFRVGDTRTIVVTDLESGAATAPIVTELAMPTSGIVSIDRTALRARAAGDTVVEVEVGRCREALPVHVE